MPSSPVTHPDHGTVTTSFPPATGRGEGHDPRGPFLPGNHCGQGNPAAKQTAAFRQALRGRQRGRRHS